MAFHPVKAQRTAKTRQKVFGHVSHEPAEAHRAFATPLPPWPSSLRGGATPAQNALYRSTDLEEVEVGKISAGADYADLDDLWFPFAAGVGGVGRFVQSLDGDARARMKAQIGNNLGNPKGTFRLVADAWYVRGRVSS